MASLRFRYREELYAKYVGAASEDFVGQILANFGALDLLWPNGTTDDQMNRFWCDFGRTITTGANDDLDLTALTNGPGGATVNFAEVRAILVKVYAANTTVITAQPGASNGWTALGASFLQGLKAGTNWRLINGVDGKWPVSGSDKVLRMANAAGATATYDILLIGTAS